MYVCITNETLRKYVAYCGLNAKSNRLIYFKIMNNEWFNEKIFLHFLTELKIHHFSYSAHEAFNIVDPSSMQKWLSSSWSLCGSLPEHHAGREGLSLDSLWLIILSLSNSFGRIKEKKTFFMCLSKINKHQIV